MVVVVLALTISGIIILFIANALYKRTNHYNNQFVDVRKYWDMSTFPKDLQVVNLGSNHPKFGFDYSETGLKAMNCAVGPQTLEYDFAILRKITPYLSSGARVIIPICLLKLFLYRQKSRSVHAKYYTFLSHEDIVGCSKAEQIRLLKYPLIFNPRLLRFVIRDVPKDTRLELTENPMKDTVALNMDADSWINCWNREFDISLPNPKLSKENESDISQNICILREMLEYCKLHNFKPIITILPVTKYLSSRFTDEFIHEHILRYIDAANSVNAPVLNFLKDERFTAPELYINSFFMNKKGRTLFANEFINRIMDKTNENRNTDTTASF